MSLSNYRLEPLSLQKSSVNVTLIISQVLKKTLNKGGYLLKNQTEKEWLSKNSPQDLGTGVFLFSDDDGQNTRKVFVENITYDECLQRGETAFVFKWVPHRVASYEDITKTSCSLPPKNENSL